MVCSGARVAWAVDRGASGFAPHVVRNFALEGETDLAPRRAIRRRACDRILADSRQLQFFPAVVPRARGGVCGWTRVVPSGLVAVWPMAGDRARSTACLLSDFFRAHRGAGGT